jgi:Tfp pilus assembly protein PilZ
MLKMKIERKVVRFQTKIEALQVNESPGTGTFLSDLSALGMKIETPIPFALRDLVSLKFLIPEETEEILVGGKVMWVRPLLSDPPRFLVGVKLFLPQWQLDHLGRRWQWYKVME